MASVKSALQETVHSNFPFAFWPHFWPFNILDPRLILTKTNNLIVSIIATANDTNKQVACNNRTSGPEIYPSNFELNISIDVCGFKLFGAHNSKCDENGQTLMFSYYGSSFFLKKVFQFYTKIMFRFSIRALKNLNHRRSTYRTDSNQRLHRSLSTFKISE